MEHRTRQVYRGILVLPEAQPLNEQPDYVERSQIENAFVVFMECPGRWVSGYVFGPQFDDGCCVCPDRFHQKIGEKAESLPVGIDDRK